MASVNEEQQGRAQGHEQDQAQARAEFPHQQLTFVLDRPRHPGNVGAAARALRVMGWRRLALVSPLEADALTDDEALAFASRATDVLASAVVESSLEPVIAGATLVFAMSGKVHEFAPPVLSVEQAADVAVQAMQRGEHVAFVFGNERTGLDNATVQRCNRLVTIDTADDYDSLNVAQALMVISYALRRAWRDAQSVAPYLPHNPGADQLATQDAVLRMLDHLQQTLIDAKALDPDEPKRLMPRLRRLFARAQPERAEVQLWHGICAAIQRELRLARKAP